MSRKPLIFARPRRAPLLVSILTLVVVIFVIFFDYQPIKEKKLEIVIATLTIGIAIFTFFVNKSHTETQIFLNLFRDFNIRYDQLNTKLNEIRDRDQNVQFEPHDISVLNDFFNLCAEEFYFYDAGYIDKRAWKAWRAGMKHYWDCKPIQDRWKTEFAKQPKSYYGFSIDILTRDD